MFTKKTYADVKKSTLKIQDCKKDSATRLKHLKTILDFVDNEGAKSLFETNYSHVYYILYDTFVQAETNLKQKELPFHIAHKAHREELDGSLWLLGKILCLLPELLARRWQCHSLSRIMAKLLHLGNSPKLRKEGVRYFLLWYQALGDNAPNYVHTMFADLIPGLIVPQKGFNGPDVEFNSSDLFNHPNMKVEVGTSVFHDMFSHPVQTAEINALLPPSSSEKSAPPDPKEGLEVLLNSMVQSSGCLKWRDNGPQKDTKSFAFLLNRFKEVFLPVFCPNFDVTNSIYDPRSDLPVMRTVNKKDEVMSSCVVVLINWISRFVHEKLLSSKLENIHIQDEDQARLTSNPRFQAYLQGTIVRDVLYSTKRNVNFIHEVYRQAFLLGFTSKSQIDAIRTSIAVYRDWMTSNNPPPFMLEPDDGDNYSTGSSSMETTSRGQKLRTASYVGAISKEVLGVQAGVQNVLQVFVTNAANVFLVNTSHLNIVFPSVNRDYRSTPLNEQTDICKKVLNVYRTMVMNTRMEPKTWEQLLLVLLQVTSIVLNQNSSGSRPALGTRLGQAIFQTLIVTWIRAHTNVPINVQLWERFLNVLTSLTYREELINEWDKTMQTLTRVLGRYVYNLNLQDLPLDRLTDSKGKRRRIASVWQSGFKEPSDSTSARANNGKNTENNEDQQRKEEESNGSTQSQIVSRNTTVPFTPLLGRCHSEGSLTSARGPRIRVHNGNHRTLAQPASFEHSLNAILDQNSPDILINSEKLISRTHEILNQSTGRTLRRAISLSSFQLKNTKRQTKNGDNDSLQESRSPSPTASSGIEGGSMKDSPMQIDALVADAANFEDNSSVTSSERRSIILGGSVSGWLPDTAAIMWKRMLGSLGDINKIPRPELHAQVFRHLVDMTHNLIKLKQNQGISEDNQSTPAPPNLIPPVGIAGPWCYEAQLLSPDFKKGKLSAIQMLCMLAVNGSVNGMSHLSLFYNLFHKILTGEDRSMIYCLFKYLEGPRLLSLLLPGHTLLLLDVVHASAVLLTSQETNRNIPRAEVVALLGSLLCYPSTVIPKPVLQPSMTQIELMECPDLQDHILNIILRCARREPSSKARCVAFSQLGQWIYLELNRPINLNNTFSQPIPHHLPRTQKDQALTFNSRIKEAVQVLLQALQFKHRTMAVVAAGSLKICSERGQELSKIERLPQLIVTALCKALEVQHVLNPKESDKIVLTTLMMCLGEFCMSFPVNLMLEPINKDGDSLIIIVLRVLFQILSGTRQNIVKFTISDNDFDFNITTDDVLEGKFNCEANFQTSETIQRYNLAIQLCAKAVIMHLVTYLGHFPMGIGASRLSSLVEEQDDMWSPNIGLIGGQECRRDSADLTVPQVLQSQSIQLFMLNSGLMASFIELPALKLPGGGVTAGLVTADKQVRVLLRDLNGKSCWEASILYSEPKESRRRYGLENYFQQNVNSALSKKNQVRESIQPFYSLVSLDVDFLTIPRHTMRHRQPNKLPLASDMAPDLDQLDDLLQYIGHTSPECLISSATQLNTPGTSPLGCQLEAQTISILLNQRSIEQEYVANLRNPEREKQHFYNSMLRQSPEQSFESYNTTSLYKSEVPFQYCRLLFSHLGLAGWERRSRSNLLQRTEKLMRELRNVDIQKCRDTHKVAVIYVACGQEDKNSILKNTYGSSAYEMFVSALGWEIDLETHNGFLGGLPRQGCGATAPYYATPFTEVIYHVATRMPVDTPEALLTKTRHLGNDEVHIVWSEHHRDYRRDILPTEFCDVLIVVYPLKNCLFRVTVNWKPDVPWFGPLANESVVNGSCLATLIRETAINASRSKRSSLSLYQQYYEERNRSLESVSMRYKENSTFEDFANRIYSPIPPASYASLRDGAMGTGSAPLAAALIDHRSTVKGWVQTTVDSTIRDLTQTIITENPSPRGPRKLQPFKSSSKKTSLHQNNTPPDSPTLPGRKLK